MRILLISILTVFLTSPILAEDAEADRALSTITEEAFKAHLEFLADDLLEGRGAGTRGYELAAVWLASQFRELGLDPAGDNGTYFQTIPFRSTSLVPQGSSVTLQRGGETRPLTLYEDVVIDPSPLHAEASVTAPVVFVGFGVTAPEAAWDDYARVDVKGKIVAYISGAPPHFSPTLRAHHSSNRNKAENAARHGAVGILGVRTPSSDRRFPWERTVIRSKLPDLNWIGPDGTVGGVNPGIRGRAGLSVKAGEELFRGAKISYANAVKLEDKATAPRSVQLPVVATITTRSAHETTESANVVAMLPGSDSQKAREALVYSAHLDHLGITEPVKGDRINNGAFDNATGIASLVEVARAFKALDKAPPRSIVFLAVTAEEKGLLGSDYFARYPTIPREMIVGNINMDMFLMLYPFRDTVVLGYEHSSFASAVDRAAAKLRIRLTPDPAPEETGFVRSDQYSFVRQGVPAITTNEGIESGDAQQPGSELLSKWRKTVYHTPADDLDQPMVISAGVDYARFNFLIGLYAARDPERPRWNAGDFFGTTFGR